MDRLLKSFLLTVLAFAPLSAQESDPYLWLEEVESQRSLDWARAKNKESLAELESDPRFSALKAQAEAILEAKDKIPAVARRGAWLYNFWQDDQHVRGLLRRTTLEEYRKAEPAWETVLDVDALGAVEKQSWVYKGMSCLPPEHILCLVKLSRGGKDALELREFNTLSKSFVPAGFFLKEAKTDTEWLDENTLLVGSDFGPGSLTESGYPRMIKRWRRGTKIETAPTVFETKKEDVSAWPIVSIRPEGKTVLVGKSPDFFSTEAWLLLDSGEKIKLPIPLSSSIEGLFKGRVLIRLREDWSRADSTFTAGSLVALDLGELQKAVVVFRPDARSALESVATTKDALILAVMTDARIALRGVRLGAEGIEPFSLPVPQDGTALVSHSDDFSADFFFEYQNFLFPTSLLRLSPGDAAAERLKSLPARFNAAGFQAEQKFASAKDGTQIPYFLITATGTRLDGSNPTILYGYGGFEVAMRPQYLSTLGPLWLERGGSYALANIRGGGEYGPAWHRAALKENRPVAFSDFETVAEHLAQTGVSSPRRLGIMGGSNGGLLVGAVMTRRPELFNAVACSVPLLDMLRFHKLLAGASWVGEYGNPDDAKAVDGIRAYSPYHNLKARSERPYPEPFFMTSTKDDRVHPGHARKMAAKMEALGHKAYYYENIEGGHSAAADLKQSAFRRALETVYLLKKLKD